MLEKIGTACNTREDFSTESLFFRFVCPCSAIRSLFHLVGSRCGCLEWAVELGRPAYKSSVGLRELGFSHSNDRQCGRKVSDKHHPFSVVLDQKTEIAHRWYEM